MMLRLQYNNIHLCARIIPSRAVEDKCITITKIFAGVCNKNVICFIGDHVVGYHHLVSVFNDSGLAAPQETVKNAPHTTLEQNANAGHESGTPHSRDRP